jgi:NAD(P)-dependent dehydrogenase (short-subunit alcohol dehydrogenase family)
MAILPGNWPLANGISEGEIGNGRATAILLARQGAKVALVDLNASWAEETKHMISIEGSTTEVIEADVTNEEDCKRVVARTIEVFGALHILINNGEVAISSESKA